MGTGGMCTDGGSASGAGVPVASAVSAEGAGASAVGKLAYIASCGLYDAERVGEALKQMDDILFATDPQTGDVRGWSFDEGVAYLLAHANANTETCTNADAHTYVGSQAHVGGDAQSRVHADTHAHTPAGKPDQRSGGRPDEHKLDSRPLHQLDPRPNEHRPERSLQRLDELAWRTIKHKNFGIATFGDVGRYLLLRHLDRRTSETDRARVRSAMILNLFMLQSCFLDKSVIFWKSYVKPSSFVFDTGGLTVFAPNHYVLRTVNLLKHYYELHIFGKKVTDILKLMIEALEPAFCGMASENRLYVVSVLKELMRCHTWPKDSIAAEMMMARVGGDELRVFDRAFDGVTMYESGGRRYAATREKFFLPLD